MTRRPTSIYHAAVLGRPHGGVRVHAPSERARQAGKNSYRVIFRDRDSKQIERSSTTFEGAVDLANDIARRLARETAAPLLIDPTFGEIVDYYLYGDGRPVWRSESTELRNFHLLKRVLTEPILSTKVSVLVARNGHKLLEQVMTYGRERGLVLWTNEYQRTGDTLRRVFDIAAEHGVIEMPFGNPMHKVDYKVPTVVGTEDPRLAKVEYISDAQRPPTERVLEFVDAMRTMFGEREALYVQVLAFGGLRPGEANALTPAQILHDTEALRIDRQVKEITGHALLNSPGPTRRVRLPKWSLVREAFVAGPVYERLKAVGDEMQSRGQGDNLLFPNRAGDYRWQSNWRRDRFEPVAEHVGWPRLTAKRRDREEHPWVWSVYAFRHHYANHLLKDVRVSLPSLAHSMGHQNMRVTERMYIHVERSDIPTMSQQYKNSGWADRV